MIIKSNKHRIQHICGHQIFDSRGVPTVLATVHLAGGSVASASVPSGASTGRFEAYELRDSEKAYHGKGVMKAVQNINTPIHEALVGCACDDQTLLDHKMIALDGTQNKSHLGANAMLAVSLACARAAAMSNGMELFTYLGGKNAYLLPVPMMNILNGGAHASNNVEIQEFMIMPVGAKNFVEAMRMGTEIYATLGNLLKKKGLASGVGDEGGFAPNLESDEQALQLIMEAIEEAGYRPQTDIKIALDAAASEWYQKEGYVFPKSGRVTTREELIDYFISLSKNYPICSLEDPLAEDDFAGFTALTKEIGSRVQVVGDDLFVTNKGRLQQGIEQKSGNAILIKPNQIGTLSETLETIRMAKANGYRTIISHRSGETEDTAIADLAVAVGAGQIKTGAPARTDRVSKYNRLLWIESMMSHAGYGVL